MRHFVSMALVLFFLMLAAPPSAFAQKRVAMVVGNSTYRYTPALANPKNDASDLAAVLGKLGFEVIHGLDLDKVAFDRKMRDFASALKGASAGVFFYAGHGLQIAGKNYLVPIDAKAEEAATLDLEMISVDVVHGIMERQTETNVLFLDAYRDNPLARNLASSMGTRSAEIGRGLAQVQAGVGTLISFSTQPGNVALDGTGRNSPFAGALVRRLAAPKEDLSAILIEVRNEVIEATRNRQVPWEHSALRGRFYFGQTPQAEPATPALTSQISEAERTWQIVQGTQSITVLEDFIARYKATIFAELARERIDGLKKKEKQTGVAASPPLKDLGSPNSPGKKGKEPPSAHNSDCDPYQICLAVQARSVREGKGGLSASWCQQDARERRAEWCNSVNRNYARGK